jgi:transcription antitermination factor NusG
MQPISNHIIKTEANTINFRTGLLIQQKSWYALYTRPHHEKKVFEQLQKERLEAFLPLQVSLKQWSDRKKKVSEPLFSCYLFVKIAPKEYYKTLNIPGIVRFITFAGKAVSIPESKIELIKNLLVQDIELEEIVGELQRGAKVEVRSGPFIGLIGELIKYANSTRVIIRIQEINKVILVNIPLNYLRKISTPENISGK